MTFGPSPGLARPPERACEDFTLPNPSPLPHPPRPTLDSAIVVAPTFDPLCRRIVDGLEDAKAEDILSIDLKGKTSLADLMVIATGRSTTHVGAIADKVARACKDAGVVPRIEGLGPCDWVLVDASDVIVHIFRPEVRQFYNLEKLWGVDRPGERQVG